MLRVACGGCASEENSSRPPRPAPASRRHCPERRAWSAWPGSGATFDGPPGLRETLPATLPLAAAPDRTLTVGVSCWRRPGGSPGLRQNDSSRWGNALTYVVLSDTAGVSVSWRLGAPCVASPSPQGRHARRVDGPAHAHADPTGALTDPRGKSRVLIGRRTQTLSADWLPASSSRLAAPGCCPRSRKLSWRREPGVAGRRAPKRYKGGLAGVNARVQHRPICFEVQRSSRPCLASYVGSRGR